MKGKNLRNTHLVEFDLRNTDLRSTDLRQANLSRADITGAKLYGSARENWIIDGIRCDYVYWDEAGEQRTPPDRDFRPGEFEELYKQLPTFEYIFEQGFTPLDPLIMDRVVQAVNERHKEFSLELVNFDKRGQPHATFTVCHLEHVEKAKQQIAVGYEESRIAPEQQAQLMAAVLGLIENQNKLIDKIPSSRGLAMGDNYYISGGQIGAVGQSASASGNTFQQITADLSRLHEEMQQRSAKTPEQRAAAEDVAKAAQAAREQNEPAMWQHLKNAGRFALDCAKTVGTDVAADILKKVAGL
ncbi:pentapeptide repeat-containing protein [Candidatus Electronema sp. JC]|uniref:pentapeptide repeat-containing protein n=1 Tax=Candidatus Electronema sp. JC TaxID=3401570 RepID=UPI003B4372B2